MSSISVRIDGDMDKLIARLNQMSGIDKAGIMNAIAEGNHLSAQQGRAARRLQNQPDLKTPSGHRQTALGQR